MNLFKNPNLLRKTLSPKGIGKKCHFSSTAKKMQRNIKPLPISFEDYIALKNKSPIDPLIKKLRDPISTDFSVDKFNDKTALEVLKVASCFGSQALFDLRRDTEEFLDWLYFQPKSDREMNALMNDRLSPMDQINYEILLNSGGKKENLIPYEKLKKNGGYEPYRYRLDYLEIFDGFELCGESEFKKLFPSKGSTVKEKHLDQFYVNPFIKAILIPLANKIKLTNLPSILRTLLSLLKEYYKENKITITTAKSLNSEYMREIKTLAIAAFPTFPRRIFDGAERERENIEEKFQVERLIDSSLIGGFHIHINRVHKIDYSFVTMYNGIHSEFKQEREKEDAQSMIV